MELRPPIIQLAIDFTTLDEALACARVGIEAGVDWLEAGTPLIVNQGAGAIGALVRAFPGRTVLADYKTMDSGGKNVLLTRAQGGHVMTVCGGAPDATVRSAIAARTETGVAVVVDTIGVRDQAARARQCAEWGADMIYLHYGADQRRADASQDATPWIAAVQEVVKVPIGVGSFGIDDAVRAVQMGVELVAIGHPLISSADPLKELSEFVRAVRENYRPRK
jgi:3-hexulose-6-phosphate synthase/6-phospho-3-hexuloisomerase